MGKKVPDVVRWFKDGDHPAVDTKSIERGIGTNFNCCACGKNNWLHGYIRSGAEWATVCPGNYIVRNLKGDYVVMNEHDYELYYKGL